jgi:GntR family transcriptional regulator, galactonate operon transcriptional repressor
MTSKPIQSASHSPRPERTYPDRGVHGRVVRAIGADIIAGRFAPSQPLPPEPDMMVRLGVSRTALREAVKVLAAKGLVQSRPRTGTRVRSREEWNLLDPDILAWHALHAPDPTLFDEMIALRTMIEPKAARLAAQYATVSDLRSIKSEVKCMRDSLADPEGYFEHDVQFHKAVLTASGNRFVRCMTPMVESLLQNSCSAPSSTLQPSMEHFLLHSDVADAILAKDADGAEAAMKKVINIARRRLLPGTTDTIGLDVED